MARLTFYTNMKALLSQSTTTFTTSDIGKAIGLYLMHGISPSPRIEYKFKPQHTDPINGSDLVFNTFGLNAIKRFKEFKKYFTMYDSREVALPRKECPNYKVKFLFDWMNQVARDSWVPGKLSYLIYVY